ncbi:DUF3035 domain-containing protein [Planktotalea sp.]|uniref:DUF3035 domain-containing protein n=1 Tax=Planktotalea sp. TaxID=2029877 RepID=UPI003D6A6DA1
MTDLTAGPEEFDVLPNKPLQKPDNYKTLPTPTPGQANLVDATPKQDAIVALGGNPARLNDKSVPRSDSALIASASRYGVPGNIRETTTAEDAAFRKRRGRLTNIRLFKTDSYTQVYKRHVLDAERTLDAHRRAGRKTPTAPPAN